MGHSYVEYRGSDLLMHDTEIVTIVSLVLDTIRGGNGVPALTDNVKRLMQSWEHLFDAYGPGCLGFEFDRFIVSEDDRGSLLRLLDHTARRLEQHGQVVSGEYLNRIAEAEGVLQFRDRATADILSSFARLRSLLATRPA